MNDDNDYDKATATEAPAVIERNQAISQLEAQRNEAFEHLEWLQARKGIMESGTVNQKLEDDIIRTERQWYNLACAVAHWEGVPTSDYGQPN